MFIFGESDSDYIAIYISRLLQIKLREEIAFDAFCIG